MVAESFFLISGWGDDQGWLMIGSATLLVSATVIWRSFGNTIGARLVHLGCLPQVYARRRLLTAIELMRIRLLAGQKDGCLELEACLSDHQTSTISSAMEHVRSLSGLSYCVLDTLTVHHCPAFSNSGLQRMVEIAQNPENKGLRVLYLRGCRSLGDNCCESLGRLISMCESDLKDLGVVDCGITATGISNLSSAVLGFEVAESAPQQVSALQIAELLAGDAPASLGIAPQPLASVPGVSSRGIAGLSTLHLSSNSLAGAGRSLGALIRNLQQLHWLSLEACELQVEDVQQVARALPQSKVVRLDLAENALRSRGLLALVSGLRTSGIEDLGIERNGIGVGEALSQLKAAHDRRPFPILRLRGNSLTPRQESAFLQALRLTPKKRLGSSFCPPGCMCFYGRDHVM